MLILNYKFYYILRLKKSAEHRKKVLQHKKALEERKSAIPFVDILSDRSEGKVFSHQQLIAYCQKFGESAFAKVYLKSQLQKLCKAYGIIYNAKCNKAKIAQYHCGNENMSKNTLSLLSRSSAVKCKCG